MDGAQLLSVSCPSASFCVAVDARGGAVRYDGSGWGAPVDIDGSNQLTSVSCPSASFCVAVDGAGEATTFDGAGWGPPRALDPGGSLSSVSCPSSSFCAAVDRSGRTLSYDDGAWGAPDGVDPGHSFTGVSCPSASFCLAVDSGSFYATDDAGTWSAAQPMVIEELSSVSCATPTFCVAVNDGNGLAPTYDGLGWAEGELVSAEPDGPLRAVSCASPTFCVTVDDAGNAITYGDAGPLPPVGWNPPGSPAPPSPPVRASAPVISGSPVTGAILTETHGTWTNAPTAFSYQWERCDRTGGSCAPIPAATSQAYLIPASDVGDTLRVAEVASNASGPGAAAVSPATAVVSSEAVALSDAILAGHRSRRLSRLLRRGGQWVSFHASAAGHLAISWSADLHARRRRRVVIARLSLNVPAGATEVRLSLAPGARRLLAGARAVRIAASGVFTPAGKAAISVRRHFTLRR